MYWSPLLSTRKIELPYTHSIRSLMPLANPFNRRKDCNKYPLQYSWILLYLDVIAQATGVWSYLLQTAFTCPSLSDSEATGRPLWPESDGCPIVPSRKCRRFSLVVTVGALNEMSQYIWAAMGSWNDCQHPVGLVPWPMSNSSSTGQAEKKFTW